MENFGVAASFTDPETYLRLRVGLLQCKAKYRSNHPQLEALQ